MKSMARYTKKELISFENNIIKKYKDNQLPFLFHLCGGNEDQLIKIFNEVKDGDYVFVTHRNHYHAYLHGIDPKIVLDRVSNGRSMFMYDREKNFFSSAIVGGIPEIAAGVAMALKRKKSKKKVWCFVGDGAEDTGHFYSAVRYVESNNLPCKFIVEDNDISIEASKEDRWGSKYIMNWPNCVLRYNYELEYPHARIEEFCDLSIASKYKKTDKEYFPDTVEFPPPRTKIGKISTLTFNEAVTQAMTELGRKEDTIFIGYNVGSNFGNAMGNFKNIEDSKKIETPVAENLMSSLAMGLALEEYKPIVYYERHDFMMVAMDSLVNHISQIERISHQDFKTPIIFRTVVADEGPFYSGPTHSQDFTNIFRQILSFPVLEPQTPEEVVEYYDYAYEANFPVMIVEKKSKF
ncbi:thiamine pyrophosphate-dependent enzyme [Acidimicrobiia bacterium]|nr:thiamine pyrophosphate-dependent enzyme [Acidimicrobiia bacterium]